MCYSGLVGTIRIVLLLCEQEGYKAREEERPGKGLERERRGPSCGSEGEGEKGERGQKGVFWEEEAITGFFG